MMDIQIARENDGRRMCAESYNFCAEAFESVVDTRSSSISIINQNDSWTQVQIMPKPFIFFRILDEDDIDEILSSEN